MIFWLRWADVSFAKRMAVAIAIAQSWAPQLAFAFSSFLIAVFCLGLVEKYLLHKYESMHSHMCKQNCKFQLCYQFVLNLKLQSSGLYDHGLSVCHDQSMFPMMPSYQYNVLCNPLVPGNCWSSCCGKVMWQSFKGSPISNTALSKTERITGCPLLTSFIVTHFSTESSGSLSDSVYFCFLGRGSSA